jgi:hypothetical protein
MEVNQSPNFPAPPASSCQLMPLGHGGRALLLDDIAAIEVAVEVKVVVD